MWRWTAISGALAGVAMFVAACGGGGGGDEDDGVHLTNPAAVPSSTRIANAVLYQVQGNQIIATGATAASQLPTSEATQRAGGGNTHVVVAGETCASIAQQYEVGLPELIAANRFINEDCSNLQVDDELRIPGAPATNNQGGNGNGNGTNRTPTPGSSGGGQSYTVASGDTCDGIASSFGISVDELISANPSVDSDCSNLDIDQVLRIP